MDDKTRLDWLEEQVKNGACPAVINDDDGRWAVCFDGFQNVPIGEGAFDLHTTFFIEAKCFRNTIREAIDSAMSDGELGIDLEVKHVKELYEFIGRWLSCQSQ